jgi:hypothetical protein
MYGVRSDSEDGTLLAYGSSDLSIGILDAITLRVSKCSLFHRTSEHQADIYISPNCRVYI